MLRIVLSIVAVLLGLTSIADARIPDYYSTRLKALGAFHISEGIVKEATSARLTPYAIRSTHLMFLTKKRTDNEPTEYRTLEFRGARGANVGLTPFGHEKMPDGKTVRDKITSLLKETAAHNEKQHEKEQAFLNQMIRGTAEPRQ